MLRHPLLLPALLLAAAGAGRASAADAPPVPLGPPTPCAPVLELAYAPDPELHLAGPAAQWWQEACAESGLRWRQMGGGTGDLSQALAGIRSLRVAFADGQDDDAPAWSWRMSLCCEGGPAAAAARLIEPLSSQVLSSAGDRLTLQDVRVPLAAPPPAPGWQLSLHGSALQLAVTLLLGVGNRQIFNHMDQKRWTDAFAGLSAELHVGAHGALLRCPAQACVRALDPMRLAGIPADLAAVVAVGIDGPGLALALLHTSLDPFSGRALRRLCGVVDSQALACGLDGTVLLAWWPDGGWNLCLPRAQELDRVLAGASAGAAFQDGQPLALAGLSACRTNGCWILGDTPEHCAAWLAPRACDRHPRPAPGQVLWGFCRAPALCTWMQAIGAPALVEQFGLPASAAALQGRLLDSRQADARELSATALARLASCTEHRFGGQVRDGRLELDCQGPLLPWLPVLMVVGGGERLLFTQVAMSRLQRTLSRLRAYAPQSSPLEGVSGWSAAGRAYAHRAAARIARLPAQPDHNWDAWWSYTVGGPVSREDPAFSAQFWEGEELLRATSPMDAGEFHGMAALTALAGRADPEDAVTLWDAGHSGLDVRLLQSGLCLVAMGDARGLVLCDRSLRMRELTLDGIFSDSLFGHELSRDEALLAAAEQGLVSSDEAEVRLAHAVLGDRQIWQAWLRTFTEVSEQWFTPRGPRPASVSDDIVPRLVHPWAGLNTVLALAWMMQEGARHVEPGSGSLASAAPPTVPGWVRSPAAEQGLSMPDVAGYRRQHALIAIAVRLLLHRLVAPLPASQAQAEAVAGPLQAPLPAGPAPVVYQRSGRGGFTLRLAADDVLISDPAAEYWPDEVPWNVPAWSVDRPHLLLSTTMLAWEPAHAADPLTITSFNGILSSFRMLQSHYLVLPDVPVPER